MKNAKAESLRLGKISHFWRKITYEKCYKNPAL